jgi:hypothetical protein
MRVGGSQKPIRIYYTIEDAAAVLEQCVGKAEAVEDSYSLPFAATRPNLLRAMLLPLSLAIPCFAAGIPALMDGIVFPIILFGLVGTVILAGFYAKHAQAPSKISVSEAGVVLVRKAEGEEYVRWDDVTDIRLAFQEKWRIRPSLLMEWKGGPSLQLNASWVDPIRLVGLMKRAKDAHQ